MQYPSAGMPNMKRNPPAAAEPPYRAFLLRCWCDGDPDSAGSWRFVVVEIDQHQRHGFIKLQDLVTFLQAELYGNGTAKEEVTRTDHPPKDK